MDPKKLLPIAFSQLEAKQAAWPPSLFTGLTRPELLMMVEGKDSQERLVVEMCVHRALTMARNIMTVIADRIEVSPEHKLSLELVASAVGVICDQIPSCSERKNVTPIDKGKVN